MNAQTHEFQAMRHAMVVSQLRPSGVNDPRVLDAMARLPRELFVPEERRALAYVDGEIPLGNGRFLMSSMPLGLLLTEAQLGGAEKVLVIGGGLGYSAAVLAMLGAKATLLESDEDLARRATQALAAAGVTADVVSGPLADGWAEGGPYDFILIDGAVEQLPDTLTAQLVRYGRIAYAQIDGAAATGTRAVTRLAIGTRTDDRISSMKFADVAVPQLPGFAPVAGFTF